MGATDYKPPPLDSLYHSTFQKDARRHPDSLLLGSLPHLLSVSNFLPLDCYFFFYPRSFCHLIISIIYLGPFLLLLTSFIMLISQHNPSVHLFVCLFFCSRVTSSSGMVCRVEWSYFVNFIFFPFSPSITLYHPISYQFTS